MSAPVTEREAVKAARDEAKTHETPMDVETPDHRRFRRTGFSHMPLKWDGSPVNKGDEPARDALMIARIHTVVIQRINTEFADLYEILFDLYERVRTQKVVDGELVVDDAGWPVWETTPAGNPVEDWTRIGIKEREHFLYLTTTRLVDWRQRANEAWAEAMFSKALWEDAYSIGYQKIPSAKATIEDRTATARLESRDQRYFALFQTYYSRQAEALVDSIVLLNQRIKDLHSPGNGKS